MYPRIDEDRVVEEVKEYANGLEHVHLITVKFNNQLLVIDG